MNLITSSAFKRALKATVRKHPQLKERIAEKLELLESDPFNPIFRTHKLKGDLEGTWSCSVDYDCRIVFEFASNEDPGEEEILLITIGSHDEVY